MEKKKIIEFLKEAELSGVEEISYKDNGLFVVKFFYDYDDDEVEAARAYANDECDEEEEGEVWYDEFFMPYLNDIAVDNVGDVVEDVMAEFEIGAQFVSYGIDEEEFENNEFIAVFFEEGKDINIDDILDELEV